MEHKVVRGRYLLKSPLGKGGSSQVWLALDLQFQKEVAVKLLALEDERGERETAILEEVDHRGIPKLIEAGADGDFYCLVLEYISGQTLEKIRKNGKVTAEQAEKWGIELCRILEYLHSHQPPIIYGDLKPANVILDCEGHVHLIDFGSGVCGESKDRNYGTPGFAAPEQYAGEMDEQSDIYGLGRLLQEMTETDRDYLLKKILEKGTAKNKEKRLHSVRSFRWLLLFLWKRPKQGQRKKISLAMAVLFLAGIISAKNCSFRYEEALKRGRTAIQEQQDEENIHKAFGEAIFWEPGNAEVYLELISYYERRGEPQMGIYYVKEYQKAYPDSLKGIQKAAVDKKMLLLGG